MSSEREPKQQTTNTGGCYLKSFDVISYCYKMSPDGILLKYSG